MTVSWSLIPIGHVSVAARTWRRAGHSLLTVVVKGTFDLHHDGAMTIAAASPIQVGDRADPDPSRLLAHPSDVALVVGTPEVLVLGQTPSGGAHGAPRLVVQRGGVTLVDKTLDAQRAHPTGFGPIPSSWPARATLRGSANAAAVDSALELELPADFNDGYFQCAPPDQRVAELKGGDVVTLVNVHPQIPALRISLPMLRGAAMVEAANGQRVPVALTLDTVRLHPGVMRAEILHRGVVSVRPELLAGARIAGALEAPERPFTFPALASYKTASPRPSGARTMQIDRTPQSLPFDKSARRRRSGNIPQVVTAKAGTPWSEGEKPKSAPSASGVASTLVADNASQGPPHGQSQGQSPPAAIVVEAVRPSQSRPSVPHPPPPSEPKRVWRDATLAPPSPPQRAAPAPVLPPKADVKGSLYKKAKR
ncbi:MAG: DUF2169 domain-containing protein [Polyangiaceae bacterium]